MSRHGETWVYESIVGALPGVDVSPRLALAAQFVAFEGAVLVLGAYYGLPQAAAAGTVAVVVATVGSVGMLRIGRRVRDADVPESYRALLFGSNVEVVLAVLAYVALLTHLFVVDPRTASDPLVGALLGPRPPVLVVYLTLLILWDLCYRIGTGWWTAVVALWRAVQFRADEETTRQLRRVDLETAAFGLVQLALVPFVLDRSVLAVALLGHVVAVLVVTGLSVVLQNRGRPLL